MNINLEYSEARGSMIIPASKSFTQRVYAAALLHPGLTIVSNYGVSNDEQAALKIIQSLGAKLSFKDEKLYIKSTAIVSQTDKIYCGESGLAARLFTPIAALSSQAVLISGSGSLLSRPMHFFHEILSPLGVTFCGFEGYIPFSVCGPVKPANLIINGSLSSQFISGLLFAFSSVVTENVVIKVTDIVSKPYLNLTLEVLALFGKNIEEKEEAVFSIDPAKFEKRNEVNIKVEADWSSAAYWIAAAAINGNVRLAGLNRNSNQADKLMLKIVREIGALARWENDELIIHSKQLLAFESDLANAPDLFPVLSVLAACCEGKSALTGLHRLVNKESDRKESICDLLLLLGVSFEIKNDTIFIEGKNHFDPVKYNCPNDHRMAMAAALAVMRCSGKVEILHAGCVDKSYPAFWNDVAAIMK